MMRFALVCTAALLAAPVMAEEMVASNGNDLVHLYDSPCSSQPVLERVKPERPALLRDASATVQGQSFKACWIVDGDAAHLLYEDGDQGLIPLDAFKAPISI